MGERVHRCIDPCTGTIRRRTRARDGKRGVVHVGATTCASFDERSFFSPRRSRRNSFEGKPWAVQVDPQSSKNSWRSKLIDPFATQHNGTLLRNVGDRYHVHCTKHRRKRFAWDRSDAGCSPPVQNMPRIPAKKAVACNIHPATFQPCTLCPSKSPRKPTTKQASKRCSMGREGAWLAPAGRIRNGHSWNRIVHAYKCKPRVG